MLLSRRPLTAEPPARSLHSRPLSILAPFLALHATAVAEGLYLLPLISGQLVAYGEQETRVRFLQLDTRL